MADNSQIQQDLDMIEENIKVLEKQYNDYFAGVIFHEPKPLRLQTDGLVRKWWGKPVANTQLRFKLQNIVQRYTSYKEKWERQTRGRIQNDKEESYE